MAKVFQRSYKFLPEVFQTAINRKFLNNTMDNLVAPGTKHQLNNYIGRRYAKGSTAADRWLQEPTSTLRTAYQLEVGAASKQADGTYSFGATFEDLILALEYYGADLSQLNKILKDDFKPADFKVDPDKLVNYRQYYWLPQGPEAVPINFGDKNTDAIKGNAFKDRVLVYFDNDSLYARTSSIPEHVIDRFPNALNSRSLKDKTLTFKIAKDPGSVQIQNEVAVDPGSMIGVALNGLPFYTFTMGTKETLGATEYTVNTPFLDNHVLAFDDYGFDVVGLDGEFSGKDEDLEHRSPTAFRGHPDANGVYHYHTYTSVLYDINASAHSPILGFAFDGFPIYGPYAWNNQDGTGEIRQMMSSYKLRDRDANREQARGTPDGRYVEDYEYVDGLGDLDVNNGRFCVTPEFPNGTYAYFMTLDDAGIPAFPYIVGPNYHGSPIKQSGDIGIPANLEIYSKIADFGVNIERDIIGKTQFRINDIQFTNGLKLSFGQDTLPKSYANKEYYVEGVGSSIELIPVTDLRIPELYVGTITDKYDRSSYDITGYEEINANPIAPDYITIKRNDQSRNAWTRINRWFHIDVIEATAKYLNKPVVVENDSQAKRPIIEFDANIALYNHGYKNIAYVNIFDTTITDALSKVQGSNGYNLDGLTLANGTKIVFAGDLDPDVREKIYEVEILYLDEGRATSEFVGVEAEIAQVAVSGNFLDYTIAIKQDERVLASGTDYSISSATATGATINLVNPLPINTSLEVIFMDLRPNIYLKEVATATDHDGILVVGGDTKVGDTYYFKDSNWVKGQNKATMNVEPMFDLFLTDASSIGDRSVYQGSTFNGSKLFTYSKGTGTADSVLGFPVKYTSISNIFDIVFDWNHSKDTFSYVVDGVISTLSTENFYAYDHKKSQYRSVVLSTDAEQELKLIDVRFIDTDTNLLTLKNLFAYSDYQETLYVYLDDVLLTRSNDYDVTEIKENGQVIRQQINFRNTVLAGSKVVFEYLSAGPITDQNLVWSVPLSMSVNPYNEQITEVDLGSLIRHYDTGVSRSLSFKGKPHGRNNARDLAGINALACGIGYNNGNLLLATSLLKNQDFGFIESLEYSRDEFTKFKNNIVSIYESGEIVYDIDLGIASLADTILYNWSLGRTDQFPFDNSDMVPGHTNFVEKNYEVKYQQDKSYPLSEVYNDEEENRRAVLVYHNGVQLVRGRDYEFSKTLPTVILSAAYDIEEYDKITVREYDTTGNNFVPPTPAKLGLADVYEPGIVTIALPSGNVDMIQGHDGSMAPAYRDSDLTALILEIEKRIFNNIKKQNNSSARQLRRRFNLLPGAFRDSLTDFSNKNSIINRGFGQWILKSGLDYTENTAFTRGDQWTWNYRGQPDFWNNVCPVGHWQGVYSYYFDCQYPNLFPWQMLGFHAEPTWWQEEYGPAPYTKKNTKLWTDLELGLIRQGQFAGQDSRYVRKDLQLVIPIDDHGQLLDPLSSGLISSARGDTISAPWQFGDRAPVEEAWYRSSESKFALQELLAITDPREYFGIGFDLLDLRQDPVDGLVKLVDPTIAKNQPVRKDTVASSIAAATEANGYLAWLEGRSRQLNVAPEDFAGFIKTIEPRLIYKLSAFSDKDKLRFYINSLNPGSANALSLLPEDSYQLVLDKSAPIDKLTYSGVIVTKTVDGWKIEGYDVQNANFYIMPSVSPGPNRTVRVGSRPESFTKWEPGKPYAKGQVIQDGDNYYRVIKDHQSGDMLEVGTNLAPLSGLPEIGGVTGIIWETFDTTPIRVPYGTRYNTAQEVFDFLISYGRYLESRGFIFDRYQNDLNEILNWELSGKEFLYWTTQNWNSGAVITLSPASTGITIYIPQGDIDGLYAPSSDPRSVLNQEREPLTSLELDVDRNFDIVSIVPNSPTEKSIYYLSAIVRNTEHIAIFDNRTTFNDVVYEPVTGARQERLQIKGFKSNNWNGKFFIQGFTLDQNRVSEWASYTDYKIGDLVKLGNTVYQATENHISDVLFDYGKFSTLAKQPRLFMQANLETLADQMDQYYGLNSEQIASDVSNYARHLIGFQKRDYLEDLLANDETQFKFYQGMITQKGTTEAVNKLIRASNFAGTEIPQVDIKDEWALRVGELGLTDNADNVEVTLSAKDFYFDKTLLDFNGGTYPDRDLLGVSKDMLVSLDERVPGQVFPTVAANYKQKTAGYARLDHVDATLLTSDELLTYAGAPTQQDGKVIWVASDKTDLSPKIYRSKVSAPCVFTILDNDVVECDIDLAFEAGELIWIYPDDRFQANEDPFSLDISMTGAFTVAAVDKIKKQFTVVNGTGMSKDDVFTGFYTRINSVKFSSFTPTALGERLYDTEVGERLWIDNYQGKWTVFKHQNAYQADSNNLDVSGTSVQEVGTTIHAWNYFSKPWLAAQINLTPEVGYTTQAVAIWERVNDDDALVQRSESLRGEAPAITENSNFGAAIVSADRNTLLVGAPAHDSNTGAVSIYFRDETYGAWQLDSIIEGAAGSKFGTSLVRVSDTLILVGAPGEGKVYRLTYSSGAWVKSEFTNGATDGTDGLGAKMAYSNGLLAILDSLDHGTVHVYFVDELTATGTAVAATIVGNATFPVTAFDVWRADNEKYLAVGFNSSTVDGKVVVYNVLSATLPLAQTLEPYDTTYDREFGNNVKFSASGKLLVNDARAPYNNATTFSSSTGIVTFDGGLTKFSDTIPVRKVIVYGNYNSVWMYEQDINDPLVVAAWKRNNAYTVGDFVKHETTLYRVTTAHTSGSTFNSSNFVAVNTLFGSVIAESAGELFISQPGLLGNNVRDIKVWNEQGAGWLVDSSQQPVVDMERINRALNYDPAKANIINFLQIYDPLSDHHDSGALTNIDYIISADPAAYQIDTPGTNYWAEEAVGRVWWDNRNAFWLDYQQGDDLAYRLKHWGELYPAASIDVYEWVESTLVPSLYNLNNTFPDMGEAAFGNLTPYNTKVVLGGDGLTYNLYYFWVRNKQYTETLGGKTMPVGEIARLLILGPDKYVAVSGENNVITYNLDDDFVLGKQNLQIEILRSVNDLPQHTEWALLNEGDTVPPPQNLEAKMIDSLTGLDPAGNFVPDPKLSKYKSIGTKFRPRQSLFVDRITAIETAVEFINDRLAELILVETGLGSLNDKDPLPLKEESRATLYDFGDTAFDDNSTVFDDNVVNWDESFLTYADIIEDELPNKPVGYKILVEQNENFYNYWTVYTWTGTALELSNIQKFDVTRYWERVDYYNPEYYTAKSVPDATVSSEQEFINNNYPVGTLVKVLGVDGWKVLRQEENRESTIVAMQNGTIRITLEKQDFDSTLSFDTVGYDSALFDPQPSVEFRKVLEGLRDNIFVNGLETEWNRLFFRMVRYALVEQTYVDWAIKSSFIKVTNTIGSLTERPVYALDNQDSLEKYIKEIKPYHTKIREYTAVYNRTDTYGSQSTDFDCPPHYEGNTPVRSVIYQPNQEDLFRNYMPWRSFADNHRYSVVAVVIVSGGYGYNSIPTVKFSGGHDPNNVEFNRPATATASIGTGKQSYTTLGEGYFDFRRVWRQKQADSDSTIDANDVLKDMVGAGPYAVTRIEVADGGEGYITPPTVEFEGGGGFGVRAYAVLGDTKQRMFRVGMKFDRVKGSADILPQSLKDYSDYIPNFDEWHAADRIYAHYTPSVSAPGIPEEQTIVHSGDGSTVEFSCPFGFNYAEQIRVSIDGEIVTNYKVHETTSSIEFNSAPAAGTAITVVLVPALLPLLRGADFDRTKIVGATFNSGPGFDSQDKGFDSVKFDNWDLDPHGQYIEDGGWDTYLNGGRFDSSLGVDPTEIIRVFTGDGTTTDINLKFTPADANTLLVNVGGEIKIIDVDFTVTGSVLSFNQAPIDGEIITVARVIKVAVGDGVNKTYTLAEEIGSAKALRIQVGDQYLTPNTDFTANTDTITLTTAPSIGEVVIIENVVSSIANGGDFLSPETVPSTEECLSGQVFDTVDIKVYSSPIAGANSIAIAAWEGDGSAVRFGLTELPDSLKHITVFVNGLAQDPETVTVDYELEQLVFDTAPATAAIVTAVIVKDQGIKVHQVQNFIADGTTSAFRLVNADSTSTNADTNRSSIVVVNGVKQEHLVTKDGGDLVFTLNQVPADGSKVKVIVYESLVGSTAFDINTYDVTSYDPQLPGGKQYSETFNQVITLDPTVGGYDLDNSPGALAPLTASTFCYVVSGPERVGERLRPADTAYYIANGSTTVFDLPDNPEEDYTAYSAIDIRVAIDGLAVDISAYSFNPITKTITLSDAPSDTSLVTITTFPSGDYYIRDSVLYFNSTVNFNGTRVLVTTLNDSSVIGMRSEVFAGGRTITVTYSFGAGGFGAGGFGSSTMYTVKDDTIQLSRPLVTPSQAQVFVNGVYQQPNKGWSLKPGTLDTIIIGQPVDESDTVVVHYTTGSRARAASGFRVFKDMLGRVNFYRINEENSSRLSQPLHSDDVKIYVYNVDALPNADRESNQPGVIMIGKERIEYWTKGEGYVTDLRRGTLGTGVASVHLKDTLVVDKHHRNLVPSTEVLQKVAYDADGSTRHFNLPVELTSTNSNLVAVFVGGRRATDWTQNGVRVSFGTAPRAGQRIHIFVKQATVWYDVDNNTASLQNTNTMQARFIRDKAAVFDL